MNGRVWALGDKEVDCHNQLSLPVRKGDLAAPAGMWTGAESSVRHGICLLMFGFLGNCRFTHHGFCGDDLVPFGC